MRKPTPTLAVLISGRGSNLQALIEHAQRTAAYRIAVVISNRPNAGGLDLARAAGIPVEVVDHTTFTDRAAFDAALAERLDGYATDWVVLAGFMRVLTEGFVERYSGRLVNIHPSLLPAFPGLKTHEQALAAGVRVHGATVHLVTPALDHGPIVDQAVVQVLDGDTPQTLAERVLALEHRLFPRAIEALCAGRVAHAGSLAMVGAASQPLIMNIPLVDEHYGQKA